MKFFIILRQWAGSFRVLVEFFEGDVRTAFYVSKTNFLTKTLLFLIFFSFLDTERFFWPNLAKKVAGLSNVDSRFQWKPSGESFLQNLQIVIFLNIEQKKFSWLSKKVSGSFKLLSTSPLEHFDEKKFWKVFALFVDFFRINSGNWAGKFSRPVKTAFFVSIQSFWEKKTVLENKWKFSSFLDSEQEVFGFLASISTGMLELHSTCPK